MEIKDLVTGIQHLGLPTRDIKETVAFYRGLGFDVVFSTPDETCFFLQMGSVVIETYQNPDAKMEYGAWDHIALNVSDVEEAVAFAKKKGYNVVEGINFLPFFENGVRYFTIEGPNKEKLEFNQKL